MDGRNMSFTAIVAALRKQRQVDKQDIVATAREEYGEEFDAKFSYRKKDKMHVLSNPSGIARRYKKLKTM